MVTDHMNAHVHGDGSIQYHDHNEKYLGDEKITFTTDFLERCTKDPHAVARNFGMREREARLIAGLASQCLRLESALAACRGSLAERYGA